MSTLGKVCLVVTLLLWLIMIAPIPLPYGGWLPSLLVISNEWSVKLRDAEKKNDADIEANNKAQSDLVDATAELARLNLGWDRTWDIGGPGGNNAAGINVQQNGQRLVVNGVGFANGLVQLPEGTLPSEPGKPPVVHVFRAMPEGYAYVGEYVADPDQLGQNSAVLIRTRTPTPGEPQPWQQSQGAWRLRTRIPVAPRSSMDELNRRITRVFDYYRETDANVKQQQANLEAAKTQLNTRKGELLGNPDGVVLVERPEFVDGLLKTIDDEENRRNNIQYDVDQLRRQIEQLSNERGQLLQELKVLVEQLPSVSSENNQLSAR